jgi:predicted metal-dependent hydrolase
MRIRVKPGGVEVLLPRTRSDADAADFLTEHLDWVVAQMERVGRIHAARRPPRVAAGELWLRGALVSVEIQPRVSWRAANRVSFDGDSIRILTGEYPATPAAKTLENWLRQEARQQIDGLVRELGDRLNRRPNRIYVMDQRTRWGSCSTRANLSFSWRLIMAPEYVLRYLVTHEMVHLAIPDHSQRFWLTVQGLCPTSDQARQWLVANADRLMRVDCAAVCAHGGRSGVDDRDRP